MSTPLTYPHRDLIRLFAAIFCLVVALTAVCKVSWIPLWMAQLGATEYGHWFALAPLFIGLAGLRRSSSAATIFICLVAAGLFLSTAVRATFVARDLPNKLASAFGGASPQAGPFRWLKLWFGSRELPIVPESMIYDQQGQYTLRLDFYRSASASRSPCIVVLHTGSWANGTSHEFIESNSHFAHRGYAVAALEYRLAPRWTWPAQKDDVRTALAFLKLHAAELGVDPDKFVLLGRSAGGHIAEAVAYSVNDPSIKGCIAFYAPADLRFAYRYADENDILKSPKLLRDFLGGTPDQARENYDSASAIQFVGLGSPPTLLLHGKPDPLVWHRQSERLADALASSHVRHLFVSLPWATHAFDYNFNGPSGQLSTFAVDWFLDAVTK